MFDIGNFVHGWTTKGEAKTDDAGEGEHSNSSFWETINGISGIAGDVATTVNSLTKKGNKKVPTVTPVETKKNYTWVAVGVVVVGIAAWFIFKRKH